MQPMQRATVGASIVMNTSGALRELSRPTLAPDAIAEQKPDVVVILPWNIADEVMKQNACIRDWGGQFVTAVPELKVC